MNDFLDELQWRGLLHQTTDAPGLRAHLAAGRRRAYVGFDPTADSLTIGNLCTLMLLAHFQRGGHDPVVVAGGGTGLIGDPGGKSAERPLLAIETVAANVESQKRIYSAVLPGAQVVNNADWLVALSYVEILRDIGKHFSVNEMVKRDSVRNRLGTDGISYTEFSYMILQAYDFAHLFATEGVTMQMGGSDQWGNIVSGVDLIRRLHTGEAFALTTPLLTKADGSKFGKSESGAIWLTADRTSPYAFHQFWLNADDADLPRYLRTFTFLPREEIDALVAESESNPSARAAQRRLADEVTTLLHGPAACARAAAAGRALFTGDVRSLDRATLADVFADVASSIHELGSLDAANDPIDPVDLLITCALASSRREARELLANGSISLNGAKIGPETRLDATMLLHGDTMLLRRGKKLWHVARWH